MVPILHFHLTTFYLTLPTPSPERSEYGPCIKNLQVTVIQSTIDAAVCENETKNTGLFEMIVGVLTTCHTQHT
jgi:hypothetical protein